MHAPTQITMSANAFERPAIELVKISEVTWTLPARTAAVAL